VRIAVAQIDPVVGAFEQNVKKIKDAYKRACSRDARILVTPELGICGYPPHDLIERPEMYERTEHAINELAHATRGGKCALVAGHVIANSAETGRIAQNAASVIEDGRVVFRQAKTLLPTYDVFDEARYFEPARDIKLWECDGKRVAVAICEDLWASAPSMGRKLYDSDPVEKYRQLGAGLVLALAASPYEWGKRERREDIHASIAGTLRAPLVYANQTGATDEILFDGGSFAVSAGGALCGRLALFKQSFGVLELDDKGGVRWDSPGSDGREDDAPAEIETLRRALVTGVREYFARTGFKTCIIGLSGGIDSAVVCAIAAMALGPDNVLGVAMPSQFSSGHSIEDAEILARNLGIRFEVRPIKFLFSTAQRELSEGRGQLAPVAVENLQSRLRGMTLMTLANHYNALVLATGNKSELATGYCTLYGDMVGAIAPIGDVLKTRVYELARHINAAASPPAMAPIPERSLTKPPSAELRPGQTDQDTLPPYDALDAMIESYVVDAAPLAEIHKKLKNASWIKDAMGRIELNEFKRRQAVPALKTSARAFGSGRRVPVAKKWDA